MIMRKLTITIFVLAVIAATISGCSLRGRDGVSGQGSTGHQNTVPATSQPQSSTQAAQQPTTAAPSQGKDTGLDQIDQSLGQLQSTLSAPTPDAPSGSTLDSSDQMDKDLNDMQATLDSFSVETP
jgi:hypothetical protein